MDPKYRVIVENWNKFVNEGTLDEENFEFPEDIQKKYLFQKMLKRDPEHKAVARSSQYQKGNYPGWSQNNGNFVIVDSEGVVYYRPFSRVEEAPPTETLFDYLRSVGLRDKGYNVPTEFAGQWQDTIVKNRFEEDISEE